MSDRLVRYLTIDDWVHLAAEVLEIEPAAIAFAADLGLADSAVHAPQASFAGVDAYPDVVDKAAVLGWHLVKNHPLPDGNKRCAFVAMIVFLRLNDVEWSSPATVDAVETMLAVADRDRDVDALAFWLRSHTR